MASFNYTGLEGLDHKIYFANESGVLSYDGSAWILDPIKDFKSVFSLAQTKDSTLYVGADNEIGSMRLEEDEYRYTSLSGQLEDQVEIGEVWQTIVHEDNIYFISYSGIFKYDDTQVTWIDLPNSHTFNLNGRLIASVFGKGLYELVNDKPVLRNGDFSFDNDIAFAFLPDLNGSGYFLLTSENGIYKFDPETFDVEEVESELSLFSKELWFYDATVFNDSLYAISTWKGGLIITDDQLEILKVINTKNGLNTDEMKEVFEGSRGHLWVATNSGISELYWSGFKSGLRNPKTMITLKNEENENSISFEFATPGYHISELKYMCFLEGFESEFIPIKDGFRKEYTNLDGGEYTFKVKAKLPDGNYSKEARYAFTVPTPWYLTAEFISLSIFGPTGIFFLFYYLRTKQLKVMNETLESVVKRRTKELVFQKDQLKAANDHLK
ncbi:MAG: triple tyrosine motif-containing protein, partial [Bacteroidota bacterium]